MNRHDIILLIFSLLFLILFYLCYNNKKESFEGIAGTSFVSRVPKGTIVAYYPLDGNITTIPAGWAACDGVATLSGNIKVPDLRGRFIRMASTGLTEMSNEKGYAFDNVDVSNNDTKIFSGVSKSNSLSSVIGLYKFGEKGGSDKIQLDDKEQLPPHAHRNRYRGAQCNGQQCPDLTPGFEIGGRYSTDLSIDISSTGSSAYIPNVPPFYTLVYIIKL